MSNQSKPDLKEIFKQAAEIAAQVPESMQAAAFDKAVDLLTRSDEPQIEQQESRTGGKQPKKQTPVSKEQAAKPLDQLLHSIDSTQYPEIGAAGKVLDRSLMVLKLALEDHEVDGLKTGDISKVLTDKFRIGTSSNAVNMALSSASDLVNRVPVGQGFIYRIMEPGLRYLREMPADQDGTTKPIRKSTSHRKRKPKATDSSEKNADKVDKQKGVSKKSSAKKTKSTQKIGPKVAVQSLIDSGFLSVPRTGPEIQAELSKKRGLNFDITAIRVALLRLLRDQKIERDENKEGQYEYRAPKP